MINCQATARHWDHWSRDWQKSRLSMDSGTTRKEQFDCQNIIKFRKICLFLYKFNLLIMSDYSTMIKQHFRWDLGLFINLYSLLYPDADILKYSQVIEWNKILQPIHCGCLLSNSPIHVSSCTLKRKIINTKIMFMLAFKIKNHVLL